MSPRSWRRPGHPRDNAKVEVALQIAQRWILARLRNEVSYSLDAAQDAGRPGCSRS